MMEIGLYLEENKQIKKIPFINYKEFGVEMLSIFINSYPKAFVYISNTYNVSDNDLYSIAEELISFYPEEAIELLSASFNNKSINSETTIKSICNIVKRNILRNKQYKWDSLKDVFFSITNYEENPMQKYLEDYYRVGMDILSESLCASERMSKHTISYNLSKENMLKAGADFVRYFTDSAYEFAKYKCSVIEKYSNECFDAINIITNNIINLNKEHLNKKDKDIKENSYVLVNKSISVNIEKELELRTTKVYTLNNRLIEECRELFDVSDYRNPKKIDLYSINIEILDWIEVTDSQTKVNYSEYKIA